MTGEHGSTRFDSSFPERTMSDQESTSRRESGFAGGGRETILGLITFVFNKSASSIISLAWRFVASKGNLPATSCLMALHAITLLRIKNPG
jgi:hypothetical protein